MSPNAPNIYYTLSQEQTFVASLSTYMVPALVCFVVGIVIIALFYRSVAAKWIGFIGMGVGGCAFVILGVLILTRKTPLIFSPAQLLQPLWGAYKTAFIDPSTHRTVDPNRGGISTSEGESYTMLRAVWQGDKQTFDESWSWTQHNIERTDHLFAWLYPVTATSTVASTTVNVTGSQNSASDADTNIALALVFAYTRWQDPQYLVDARATINSIWQNETIEVQNKAYVLADNIEKTNNAPTALVDPSYVNPAAYRIFARVDAAHPWLEAVDGAYSLLAAARDSSLDTGTTAHLPPDWVSINKTTAAVVPVGTATTTSGYTSNFGYDAMRVVWNVTLDSQWNNDPRATAYLKSLSFLGSEWSEKGRLFATYTHAGVVAASSTYETPAMYGATIGYFTVADPSRAQDIYRSKLEALFDSDTNTWREQLSYYDDNWAWFGIGLYNHLLPDLSAQYPLQAMRRL